MSDARVNGHLALVSRGPVGAGRTFAGTWGTLDVTLANCRSYLQAVPSCTFNY